MDGGELVNGAAQRAVATTRVIKATPDMLTLHWPFIRQKLLIIKRNAQRPEYRARRLNEPIIVHGRSRWSPEQVRAAIGRGFMGQSSCELFLAIDVRDRLVGFVVSTYDLDPFQHVPLDFFVWLAWCDSAQVFDECEGRIVEIARERGATGIEHTSARMGWGRRLASRGYRLKFVIWRRELVEP